MDAGETASSITAISEASSSPAHGCTYPSPSTGLHATTHETIPKSARKPI
jgi:hypothetical protein